ncbi:hypothetical protein AB6W78_11540 [Pasteurella multocida]|uniref:Phosphohydrolase n=3 Tax=Pasteurella multocida TaxID=747 RepID=A0AAW8VB82_PASMD|nr:hypothetical protein [Pasteurella multocida]AUK48474.1 hypothetical protein A4210_01390 [Pasteurella multocida]AUK48863.1 hypothetical protein A4210_03535 [Pasteurella multocida]AUK53080.1 hypothetical protein A4204_01395 [Pasteurella multocida]AUK53471.1 hypothetical protein A4204_03540 [Pasteurella multocida]ESQ72262.1 hypothetical protein P1062_0201620 [Pasteurella multocida subsp. multocida P1062]
MAWIHTYSGKYIDYKNPDFNEINITDIAHHLSLENRFMGQASEAYSVASHSLFCAEIAQYLDYSPYMQLRVLMHDFHEAYVKDIPTPLKKVCPDFCALEAKFEKLVELRYMLPALTEQEIQQIKYVDLIALLMEKNALLSDKSTWPQLKNIEPIECLKVPQFSPKTAEELLKIKFGELWDKAFKAQPLHNILLFVGVSQ